MARKLHVRPYQYRLGKGVEILEGATIVATVLGTSYPLGSACQEDRDFAAVLAAGPQLLAAAKALLDTMESPRSRKASQAWSALRAAVEQAERG